MNWLWAILRSRSVRLHGALAAVAYVPLLLTQPGWVSADTKTYLYLDPGQLIGRARSMWDPSIGLGTVPHQRIGFLWPMGPYYWLTDQMGLPDWIAQRLWWGSIVFAAGAGMAYLLRVLWGPLTRDRTPAVTAAVFTYALSPLILTLMARLSGVLLPFCALPWLVAFVIQTMRQRSWRYPALFALTVATFGSVNATALLLVGVAPLLWLPFAVFASREASGRQALLATLKIACLTVPVSAWWIAGLNVQRTHGIDIIRYTETAETVASTSVSHEVLRGLGYWFFYGRDRLGPWIEPSNTYTQQVPVIAITYLVPLLGICGAALIRWRQRAYFVVLVVAGTALAVGAHPWDNNPPLGHFLQEFQSTDAGLAMRSLPRAVPLVALGLAVLLAAGVASLVSRWPRLRRPATFGAAALAIVALPPLWMGQFVPDNLRRQEVPDYWQEAAKQLDEQNDGTRVLVVPGSDFAAYEWGSTVDPVLPGLMDRASVQRENVPNGTPASANLVNALDLTLQEGTADPDALAALARLMRAGDVVVVGDWQQDRNGTPDATKFWELVSSASGLEEPTRFDEGPSAEDKTLPPDLAILGVPDTPSGVSTHSSQQPLLVAGDAAGLVDAAAAGLIDGTELIRYSASLDDEAIEQALDDEAMLLLTDSNRKRGERWNTLRHNRGYTETPDGGPLDEDPGDNRLPVFPEAGTDAQSVAEHRGEISAEATSYGNSITYVPEERPMMAVDGDSDTTWKAAAYRDARGERLELSLDEPVTTDTLQLLQPDGTRHITKVRLSFDDGESVELDLSRESLSSPGEMLEFEERSFSHLSIEVLATSEGTLPGYSGQSGVGFSEVEIGGTPNVDSPDLEAVRLPTDLTNAAGEGSLDSPMAISLARLRQNPADLARQDEERSLSRVVDLPTDRSFGLSGTARLSPLAEFDVLAELLGRPTDGSVSWARTGYMPPGEVVSTAPLAFDGDAATAWRSDFDPADEWIEINLPEPVSIDQLPLSVVADAEHSVPTELILYADGERVGTVDVPAIESQATPDAVVPVDLDLPEITGSHFRLVVSEVRETYLHEQDTFAAPVAFSEVGLPGPVIPALPERFDSGCRNDLLEISGQPVPLRITGYTLDAAARKPLDVSACESDAPAIDLSAGENRLDTARGEDTGLDIDQLVLRSDAGGAASTAVADTTLLEAAKGSAAPTATSPKVEMVEGDDNSARVRVSGAKPGEPFWMVLGQSYNDGWSASTGGAEMRGPELVDGFANGWLVTPTDESFDVQLEFKPQDQVDVALWLSLVSGLGCVVLALRPLRRPIATDAAGSRVAAPGVFDLRTVLSFRDDDVTPSVLRITTVAVGVCATSWILAGPRLGLFVGLVAAAGMRWPRARLFILTGSAAALGLAAAYVVYIQWSHQPVPSLEWPFQMRRAHPLGWLAVLLLACEATVALARRLRLGRRGSERRIELSDNSDVSIERRAQVVQSS